MRHLLRTYPHELFDRAAENVFAGRRLEMSGMAGFGCELRDADGPWRHSSPTLYASRQQRFKPGSDPRVLLSLRAKPRVAYHRRNVSLFKCSGEKCSRTRSVRRGGRIASVVSGRVSVDDAGAFGVYSNLLGAWVRSGRERKYRRLFFGTFGASSAAFTTDSISDGTRILF